MKRRIILFIFVLFSFICFASGSFDSESLPEYKVKELEQQLRQNKNVKDVEVFKTSEYAKFCDAKVTLKNDEILYFMNHYSTAEYLLKINDFIIIDWYPFPGKKNLSENKCNWHLIIGPAKLSLFCSIKNKKITYKTVPSVVFDIINNYSEFYKWVQSLPDCPFDLSREKFILPSDESLVLPESWNKYDSPYTYEIDGIPHKIFKLKIKDFDVFAEVQNFDESEKKRWICD